MSRIVRRAPALLLALSACFNPAGVDTSGEPGSTGTGTGTATATSTSATASTGAETTAPTGTTDVDPTTGDTSTTSDVSTSTTDVSSSTGTDCPVPCEAPTPVCDPGTLDCVECLTSDQCPGGLKPVCDPDSHTCRGCLAHDECDLACERDVGSCFPPDAAVLEVSTEAPCPPSACIDKPCCSLSDALKKVTQLPNQYIVIRMSHGTAAIDSTPVVISEQTGDDRRIAVLGSPPLVRIEANVAGPLISLERLEAIDQQLKTKLYLSHLQVSAGGGVRCVRATRLWIDDSTLIANSGGSGLQVFNCTANAERTTILDNAGGIEAHAGAVVGLVNTIIGGSSSQSELRVDSGSTLFGVYVTVADQPFADGSLLSCPDAVDVTLRNSILVAGKTMNVPAPVLCDLPLHIHHSVVAPPMLAPLGEGNYPVVDPEIELPFMNWAARDFLLDPGKRIGVALAAVWFTGDPRTDINGTPRPGTDGDPDYAGADVP